MSDREKRSFYEKECERSGWSVRELKLQVSTSLFERLLLSEGKANKEKVLELAEKGQEISVPEDIVKDVCNEYIKELQKELDNLKDRIRREMAE